MNKLFSIVIPTRSRKKYLTHSIKTVLSESFKNFELIVLDNASTDKTQDFCLNINDSRFIYSRSKVRLGMSENWERGIDLATGKFIFYLGDDDGLIPGALNDLASLFTIFEPKALIWRKPDYLWPDTNRTVRLSLDLRNELSWIKSNSSLDLICKGRGIYGLLPTVYSGFVDLNTLRAIRDTTGRFFESITPDVYSGFALASSIKEFLYSLRPFSLNGGSKASNGLAGSMPNGNDVFFKESSIPQHCLAPLISGCVASSVLEALHKANDNCFEGQLKINRRRYIKVMIRELSQRNHQVRDNGLKEISKYHLTFWQKYQVHKILKNKNTKVESVERRSHFLTIRIFANNNFELVTISEAATFVHKILGVYIMPEKVKKLSSLNLLVERIKLKALSFYKVPKI